MSIVEKLPWLLVNLYNDHLTVLLLISFHPEAEVQDENAKVLILNWKLIKLLFYL